MRGGGALAAAVAAGYLLGRTKKAKLALAVGTCLAGRGLGAARGRVPADESAMPRLQDIADQLRDELLASGHAAVLAADRWLTGIADARHAAGRRDDEQAAGAYDDWGGLRGRVCLRGRRRTR
jgi:hypothetical protein